MKNYKPSSRVLKLVPEIKKLYLEDQLSVAQVSRIIGIDYGTTSNVINHYLKCSRTRSENQKNVYKKLSKDQINAIKAGRESIMDDKEYLRKLSTTKHGILNPQHKLKESDVMEIRKLYKYYLEKGYKKTETQHLLADKFSVKRPTISDIVLYKAWKYLKEES